MRVIRLIGLRLYGHHGVLPAETALGQEFEVDIAVHVDFARAAQDDDVTQTLDYSKLADLAERVNRDRTFNLIEALTDTLARSVLDEFPMVARVEVTVRKPNAPIRSDFDHASVSVALDRETQFALSLGANQGEKAQMLHTAMTWLDLDPQVSLTARSRIYKTPPWGKTDQDWFANACVKGTTTLDPLALLRLCKETEMKLGRAVGERWGPRPLDIDVIVYGDVKMDTETLTLPHPRAAERGFVLIPLSEIAAGWTLGDHSVLDLAQKADPTGIEVLA